MKIYIMTDLEGAAGVNRWLQTREGETPEQAAAMRLLTGESNAAIDGILDAAPEAEVLVCDGHGTGGLVFEEMHPRAVTIMHGSGLRSPYLLDTGCDALFFVGQHAMAGTPDAPLCHTYSSRHIEYYKLNGDLIGEIGCLAAMAGSYGVPTVFLAGDDKACAEALALVPHIVTVATKQGMGIELALHLSVEQAYRAIRSGAAAAVRCIQDIAPYTINPPFELEIRVREECSIDGHLQSGADKIDERTVLRRADNLCDLIG